ncbi:hypothetical protein Tco_0463186 [Tanacetum coccineum]
MFEERTIEEFMKFSYPFRISHGKNQELVKDQLPQIPASRMSNLTSLPPCIEKLIKESRDEVTLAKRGREDKDKDEDPSAGSDRGLKERKTSKNAKPTTGPKKKDSMSGSSKGTKS